MGKIDKGAKCGVGGCSNAAERSLSKDQMSGSGLSASSNGRRVYLCHEHYKVWKKATKKQRSVEKLRW